MNRRFAFSSLAFSIIVLVIVLAQKGAWTNSVEAALG
jgi:hypothetical protein